MITIPLDGLDPKLQLTTEKWEILERFAGYLA